MIQHIIHNTGSPTYNDVIQLLELAEHQASKSGRHAANVLYELFKEEYPLAVLPSRPSRLLEAAQRIAAPIRSKRTCFGSMTKRCEYLQKEWIPRIRSVVGWLCTFFTHAHRCMHARIHTNNHHDIFHLATYYSIKQRISLGYTNL